MNWNEPKVFAVKHKNAETRAASRSGGIFTALSDKVLMDGGVVYGCILTDDFQAIHTRATTFDERNKMRGSKYVQSNMGNIYEQIKKDLRNDIIVLFSGTSCQVSGLKGFLGKEHSNLFTIDIVCHGVPSPHVWNEYLKWQEQKNKSKVISVDFRNKKDYGWADHVETLLFENGKKVDCCVYTKLFYSHSILRPSCYKCPYKNIMHPGDITIADYWGIDNAAPEFNDNKGVSLVLINNELGLEAFNKVKDSLEWKETKIEDSMQPPLKAPFDEPTERIQFWNDIYSDSFNSIAKKYGENGVTHQVRRKLHSFKRKVKAILK